MDDRLELTVYVAVRATPVYFQLSGLTVRQNGIERVTMNLQCLQPDCHLQLSVSTMEQNGIVRVI